MARLIPRQSVDEIANKPERDVARALVEGLADDCIVYHSYPWLRPERNDRDRTDTLKEGEADFVVVMPDRGLLVLEVKGGVVNYDADERLWFRRLRDGNRRKIRDPFEQARRNTYALTDQIRKIAFPNEPRIPCSFGHAVVFPDCHYDGAPPPGSDHSIILGVDDIPFLHRRIPELLTKWDRRSRPSRLQKTELDGILRGLAPSFQLMPVLFRQIEEQEEKLFRMTNEQARVLDFLGGRTRALINGVAGSGKTMIARVQAQRFADAGMQVLFVCFNKALAQWLAGSLPEQYETSITVTSFHGLCYDLCRKARVEFRVSTVDPPKFWHDKAPELLMQAIDLIGPQFDAIVVDEGQDFGEHWWAPLELLNREGDAGPLFVFYDPAQNLFSNEMPAMPPLSDPFLLPYNCRNTRCIAKTCESILGQPIGVRDDAPLGVETTTIVAADGEAQRKACVAAVREWVESSRLRPSQVAILSPHIRAKSALCDVHNAGKTRIVDDLEHWENGDGVLFATVRSFKGLEADAIVMVDVDPPTPTSHFTKADFYVGCSRAKHLLTVVLERDP